MKFIINLLALIAFEITITSITAAKLPRYCDKNKLRIVGGELASIEDFPYQVSLQYENEHYCGGSIIRPNIILTAAHCVENQNVEKFSIRAGSSVSTKGGQLIGIKKYIIHNDYNSDYKMDHDIAILLLKESLNTSAIGVSTIDLPNQYDVIEHGTMGTVSGWGFTEYNGYCSEFLLSVNQPTVSNDKCESIYAYDKITENMLCAGYFMGGRASCYGDSGGPFVVDNKLVGIVSWGVEICGFPIFPDVYTRVSSHIDWINDIIDEN